MNKQKPSRVAVSLGGKINELSAKQQDKKDPEWCADSHWLNCLDMALSVCWTIKPAWEPWLHCCCWEWQHHLSCARDAVGIRTLFKASHLQNCIPSPGDFLLFIKLGRVIALGFQTINIKPNTAAARDWRLAAAGEVGVTPALSLLGEQGGLAACGSGTNSSSL